MDPHDSKPAFGAVVLLSGGLDSATALAVARSKGLRCSTLAIDYGQRHRVELSAAAAISAHLGAAEHKVIGIDLRAIGASALTADIAVPKDRTDEAIGHGVPITYVPARNLIFLSIATGLAEAIGARDIYLGVNAIDYSGYPDCRPAFIRSFEATANLATKAGVEGSGFRVRTPLIELTKAAIIRLGADLGVDFSLTHSCYDPVAGKPCGQCDSCLLRRAGFTDAGLVDPLEYAS